MVLPENVESAIHRLRRIFEKMRRGNFMARNPFHKPTDSLREITLAVQQARNEVLVDLSAGFDKTEGVLNALDVEVKDFRTEARNFVPEVARTIEQAKKDIIGAVTPMPTHVTSKAFDCIRVLSQLQDLVLDKKPNLEQNNQTLEKIRCSVPYADAVKALEGSEPINAEFQRSFRDFTKIDFNEMSGRFIEILGLYKDLIRHFAPK
jgi:hypothetical protein